MSFFLAVFRTSKASSTSNTIATKAVVLYKKRNQSWLRDESQRRWSIWSFTRTQHPLFWTLAHSIRRNFIDIGQKSTLSMSSQTSGEVHWRKVWKNGKTHWKKIKIRKIAIIRKPKTENSQDRVDSQARKGNTRGQSKSQTRTPSLALWLDRHINININIGFPFSVSNNLFTLIVVLFVL